jgi:thiol:disulfide interchange protein
MNALIRKSLLVAVALVLVAGVWADEPKKDRDPTKEPKAAFRKISYDKALEAAKAEKKVVFLDFFATWCGPCKQLDAKTFSDAKVQKFLTDKTVAIKIDVDDNRQMATKYKVTAIPTLVFVAADGKEIGRLVGFRDVDTFLKEAQKHAAK